ncbi:L-2-hydroxyglutarate dehydrogenase, mitochondrial precursor [Mucor ambiguus]|uniref:L-2-hydroxyglutarate dehydrogenase, mitochondrial n=1 Tax=Mucor ambiguus TaxID=91626 RepID=A0A0C9MTF3_9FUNG|nr:L-2-hydroxyglutarate dehydrogenase, mitochondrial precursor [Mucor ambiguus]
MLRISHSTKSLAVNQFWRAFSTTKAPEIQVDNIVIGAGVVGLAIGEKLTRERPNETTFVVEKNVRIGEETSARNSEVIHAGLYYPEDSLKTKLCIQGNRKLYKLFERVDIPYCKLGKWVVAQNQEQHHYLQGLHEKAQRLGIETYFIDQAQALAQEPHIQLHSALVSPSTGIIDSHHFMAYLERKISDVGDVALCTQVTSISKPSKDGFVVELSTPTESTTVLAKRVFNSGGLHADKVSNMLPLAKPYKLHYARGHYYAYNAPLKVNHLIYPCPEKNLAGLGTHLTLDIAGGIKFGPDVQYIDDPYDYSVPDNEEKKEAFVNAIHSYLPSLKKDKLHADYSGIRPKLAGPGEPFQDFIIKEESDSGHDNFFTLIGIESPGLTSSLAIADHVYSMIRS